jgi:hypothetical protein
MQESRRLPTINLYGLLKRQPPIPYSTCGLSK